MPGMQGDSVKRRKRRASIIIWTILMAGVRALYVFLNWNMVTDYYGYYERAMIRVEESEPVLSSGLAYVYTNVLSKLLLLCGNHSEAALIFQGILQVAALYFFLRAMWCLWGRLAAFVSATILGVIPALLGAVSNVEPVSFYFFHFMLIFLMIGYFYTLSREEGWRRSSLCELYLILMGFYLGVVCVWNYIGFLLLILFAGVLVKTHLITKEFIWKQNQDLLEEKDQIMSTLSQTLIVVCGVLLGMFATLLKYTGLSGMVIAEQIRWWGGQFADLPGICQGLELKYAIYLVAVILTGILCNVGQTAYMRYRKRGEKTKTAETKEPEIKTIIKVEEERPEERKKEKIKPQIKETVGNPDQKMVREDVKAEDWRFDLDEDSREDWRFPDETREDEEKPDEHTDFFVTSDGRKVNYLKNPLPGPKKHVAKHLDFDFEVNMDDMLAFDRELDEIEEWERKDR